VPKLDVDATVQIGGQSKSSSHNIAFVPPATPESYGKQVINNITIYNTKM